MRFGEPYILPGVRVTADVEIESAEPLPGGGIRIKLADHGDYSHYPVACYAHYCPDDPEIYNQPPEVLFAEPEVEVHFEGPSEVGEIDLPVPPNVPPGDYVVVIALQFQDSPSD